MSKKGKLTIKKLKELIGGLSRDYKMSDCVKVEEECGCSFDCTICTNDYSYSISANEESGDKGNYLGCIVTCRKCRAGERHLRGADLPDGDLSLETWDRIIKAIVGNEIVPLDK